MTRRVDHERAELDRTRVQEYYDRHTDSFVRFGQGGGALHRAVWGPGVESRAEAFHYVEDRIASLLATIVPQGATARIVDLGCGVGASLCYLASRVPLSGVGVTISPVQAEYAARRIAAANLSERLACMEGDYAERPAEHGEADLVYAIESFVHGRSLAAILAHCAGLLRAGGLLVVCDDFLRRPAERAAAAALARFRRGWHVHTLVDSATLVAEAAGAGLEHLSTTDLTPWLELGRPRDRLLAAVVPALDLVPFTRRRLDHVIGGSALQTCLRRGWLGYDLTVFRRR